ncbi:N-acetylglucosamine kinase [Xaviernesmea oryzae]|uniref:N-acetylglucosamine kinase n=1 Tax=Xaviernesmea oryzae TaxID=464029 RepID=A0A1Q9B2M1_9HYPH|nr:N-acetylglucosamine kinase [Xaviernesmea oryzae]OLP62248.1 N-acetylglucosamine kinase [Xaviernesmea oryzae]SEL93214.1 glucosamine kinase [Xaviernesmea oryzae]
MSEWILAVDGGGTSCRAAVATASGQIVGRGLSGAANILSDPATARRHILAATENACREAGIDPAMVSSMPALLGLAGSNVGDVAAQIAAALPFARTDIVSDGLIALQGALGDADGTMAILGTGTVYFTRDGGRVRTLGGWGFQVGDQGSGAWLGHALLQQCLLAFDGVRPGSALSAAVLAEFSGDPGAIVSFARAAQPSDYGRFAPRVFEALAEGDAVAADLVKAAATAIDAALDAAAGKGSAPICLLGGLSSLYAPHLAARHRARLVAPLADALTGAVALCAARLTAAGQREA